MDIFYHVVKLQGNLVSWKLHLYNVNLFCQISLEGTIIGVQILLSGNFSFRAKELLSKTPVVSFRQQKHFFNIYKYTISRLWTFVVIVTTIRALGKQPSTRTNVEQKTYLEEKNTIS